MNELAPRAGIEPAMGSIGAQHSAIRFGLIKHGEKENNRGNAPHPDPPPQDGGGERKHAKGYHLTRRNGGPDLVIRERSGSNHRNLVIRRCHLAAIDCGFAGEKSYL